MAQGAARHAGTTGREARYPDAITDRKVDNTTWLQNQIQDALALGASDMVIETDGIAGEQLFCDIRIDGRMRPLRRIVGEDPVRKVLGSFKSLAGLSTSGEYRPQEVVYSVPVPADLSDPSAGTEVRKARVASFRQHHGGSSIVMRLPAQGRLKALDELNFTPENLQLTQQLLMKANGLIMLAGPMGSGKSTTAYAALDHVANGERTIWTIEDPVERTIPGLIQLEVDEENDAGFDALLPSLVRSDYDVLFLGEIRDKATAGAAVRQSRAGRQVFSTIHANDNVTALLRLVELAQDSPLSVLDAVRGVISQRLISKLNPDWDGKDPREKYRGRIPIHEVLEITPKIVTAISDGQMSLAEIRELIADDTISTFEHNIYELLDAKVVDEEEVTRVLGAEVGAGLSTARAKYRAARAARAAKAAKAARIAAAKEAEEEAKARAALGMSPEPDEEEEKLRAEAASKRSASRGRAPRVAPRIAELPPVRPAVRRVPPVPGPTPYRAPGQDQPAAEQPAETTPEKVAASQEAPSQSQTAPNQVPAEKKPVVQGSTDGKVRRDPRTRPAAAAPRRVTPQRQSVRPNAGAPTKPATPAQGGQKVAR